MRVVASTYDAELRVRANRLPREQPGDRPASYSRPVIPCPSVPSGPCAARRFFRAGHRLTDQPGTVGPARSEC